MNNSKWIKFNLLKKGNKTDVWQVETLDNIGLGEIKWFSRWRKYSFFPYPETIYENICLRDIANFIEGEMYARKMRRL